MSRISENKITAKNKSGGLVKIADRNGLPIDSTAVDNAGLNILPLSSHTQVSTAERAFVIMCTTISFFV